MSEKKTSLTANATALPRLHLLGTLVLMLVVTLALASFYSWRSKEQQQAFRERITQTMAEQQRQRLSSELQSAIGYLEFLRKRTESVMRQNMVEQTDAAFVVAQAIYKREAPHRPAQQVQQLIVEALRPLRFFEGRATCLLTACKATLSCCQRHQSTRANLALTTKTTPAPTSCGA